MGSMTGKENEVNTSALIDEFTYLDYQDPSFVGESMDTVIGTIRDRYESGEITFSKPEDRQAFVETLTILENAVNNDTDGSFRNLVYASQSSGTYDRDGIPTNDPIQAVAFTSPAGTSPREVYVSYRGTGNGRWIDDGYGLYTRSQCQDAAIEYFDDVCDQLGISSDDVVIVGGHSKGGNEAYYVNYFSEHSNLIDTCIPIDGEGFSVEDMNNIHDMYSDSEYAERTNRIISINGENDFVNPLGEQVVDDKYYINQGRSDGVADFHYLGALFMDEDGNIIPGYPRITDHIPADGGHPSNTSVLVSRLYESLRDNLTDEQFQAVCRAAMQAAEAGLGNSNLKIGDTDVSWTDWIYLLARGLPVVIVTVLSTEEGRQLIGELVEIGVEALKKKLIEHYDNLRDRYGNFIGTVILGLEGVALTALATVAVVVFGPIVMAIVNIINVIALIMDVINFVKDLIDFCKKILQDLSNFIRSHSRGAYYAQNNPHIVVNTDRMYGLASDLANVKTRVSRVNDRIDSLYWKAITFQEGIEPDDIDNLIVADLITQFNLRIQRCIDYLNNTANNFSRVDNEVNGLFS